MAPRKKAAKIEYKNFDLINFKVVKEGVNITHFENGSTLPGNDEKKGEVQPHPDMQNSLDKLAIYVADKIGILEGFNIASDSLVKELGGDFINTLEKIKSGREEAIKRVRVNGYSFEGSGELRGVNIKFYLKFPIKGGTGMPSGKIHFAANELGTETEIEEICEEIKKEVFAYRFQNKKAQLDIITEAEKDEEPKLDFKN